MAERDRSELDLAAAFRTFLEDAPTDVRPTELAHQFAVAHPHGRTRFGRWGFRASPALAWAVLLAGLLLALVAGALVVGAPHRDLAVVTPEATSVALVPPGIDLLAPGHGEYETVIADSNGILFAHDSLGGRLVRYDPATGSGQTWTTADDAAFSATNIAAAQAGGVWLVGPDALRRFDGTDIREVIETPTEIADVAEAPGGGLWAATSAGAILHWDGSTWTRLEVSRPGSKPTATDVRAIAVDAEGKPWIGWGSGPTSEGWLAHYDGTTWTTFTEQTAAPLGYSVRAIAPVPGGALWVATEGGLARFDGAAWTDETARLMAALDTDDRNLLSVAVGSDGAVWALASNGDTGIAVGRFDGTSWTVYGAVSGTVGGWPDSVLPAGGGAHVGTSDGIYGIADGRWERVWAADVSSTAAPVFQDGTRLLAISRDELWTTGEDGAWHFQGGSWTKESIDPDQPGGSVDDLALAPDGTVWAVGSEGVAYRRDGRWVVVDDHPAHVITFDRDGTAWAAGSGPFAAGSRCDIWMLRPEGAAWTSTPLAPCPYGFGTGGGVTSLAVDGHGTLWVGAQGFVVDGLARYADGRWDTGDPGPGLPKNIGVEVLGISATGDVWIDFQAASSGKHAKARFDGTAWTVFSGPDGDAAAGEAGMVDPAVARDGTRFEIRGGGSLVRLPAPRPAP